MWADLRSGLQVFMLKKWIPVAVPNGKTGGVKAVFVKSNSSMSGGKSSGTAQAAQ